MTNEELQGHLMALNGAASRGELQVFAFGEWMTCKTFAEMPSAHRIKPQPREVWLANSDLDTKTGDRVGEAYRTPGDPKGQISRGWRKFREVIE